MSINCTAVQWPLIATPESIRVDQDFHVLGQEIGYFAHQCNRCIFWCHSLFEEDGFECYAVICFTKHAINANMAADFDGRVSHSLRNQVSGCLYQLIQVID